MELGSCHRSGAYNFEMASRFLKGRALKRNRMICVCILRIHGSLLLFVKAIEGGRLKDDEEEGGQY